MWYPLLPSSPRGSAGERTTGELGAVPKTGSLITIMSSLKSFAFPTQHRAGASRARWADGRTDGCTAGPSDPRALVPLRGASRRSTGFPRPVCGRGTPLRARPPSARRSRPPPPAAARRCCCGCERSAGPRRRRAGRQAGTRLRTTRRTRTRRRPSPRARRARKPRLRGWRSSAGCPARSSRRGVRVRRWVTVPGLQRDPGHQC